MFEEDEFENLNAIRSPKEKDPILLTVALEDEGERIDRYLSRQISEVSRSKLSDWIKNECVWVDGKTVKPSYTLKSKQTVLCQPPIQPTTHLIPQDVPFEIIYEDDDLVVVDKPAGVVVHPGAGQPDKTLVNGLLKRVGQLSSIGLPFRPGIVHRIDRDTSGLLVVAKNDATHYHLAEQLSRHAMGRRYLAIAWGQMSKNQGSISSFYGRDPNHRIKFTAKLQEGKMAVTHWTLKEDFAFCALLSVALETGRTHQIRVHLSENQHPLVGDLLYGQKRKMPNHPTLNALGWDLGLQRHALHATALSFTKADGKELSFESPLPEDLSKLLDLLRNLRT
jgi:23S rRNA pseudouridine1911/1915/1917 synthase